MLTAKQVAEKYGVSLAWVYRLRKDGGIRAEGTGKNLRFDQKSCDEYFGTETLQGLELLESRVLLLKNLLAQALEQIRHLTQRVTELEIEVMRTPEPDVPLPDAQLADLYKGWEGA